MEEIMSNQQFGGESRAQSRESATSGPGADISNRTGAAVSSLSDAALYATDKAKQSAFDVAGTVTHQVKGLLDGQVANGAQMIGHLAKSTRRAADELDHDAPQLAGLVRGVAVQIDGVAGHMRDQTVDQLLRTASDFTRRKPALVFGLASLAGFFVLRVLKSAPAGASTSRHSDQGTESTFYGA
jgi:ABC-type transporter Mla subunit MlaD